VATNKGSLIAFARSQEKVSLVILGILDLVIDVPGRIRGNMSALQVVWDDKINVLWYPAPIVGPYYRVKILLIHPWNLGEDKEHANY